MVTINNLDQQRTYFYNGIKAYTNPGYCVYIYDFVTNQLVEFDLEVINVKGIYTITGREKMTYTADAAKGKNVWHCTYAIDPLHIMIDLMPDTNGVWQKLATTWEHAVSFFVDAPLYLVKKIVRIRFPADAKRFDEVDNFPWFKYPKPTSIDGYGIYQHRLAQFDFIESDVLPLNCDKITRDELIADGVKFGDRVDSTNLYYCELPECITKEPTAYPWSFNLVYKKRGTKYVVFFDHATIKLERRLTITHDIIRSDIYITIKVSINDGLIVAEEYQGVIPINSSQSEIFSTKQAMVAKAVGTLDNYYPFWRDNKAYWNAEENIMSL